jgi:hypothetical protein
VTPKDGITLVFVSILLMTAAFFACFVPARLAR